MKRVNALKKIYVKDFSLLNFNDKRKENENLISYKILRIWSTHTTNEYVQKIGSSLSRHEIPMELHGVNDFGAETMLSIAILPSIFWSRTTLCVYVFHSKANKINGIDLWMSISDTEEKFRITRESERRKRNPNTNIQMQKRNFKWWNYNIHQNIFIVRFEMRRNEQRNKPNAEQNDKRRNETSNKLFFFHFRSFTDNDTSLRCSVFFYFVFQRTTLVVCGYSSSSFLHCALLEDVNIS